MRCKIVIEIDCLAKECGNCDFRAPHLDHDKCTVFNEWFPLNTEPTHINRLAACIEMEVKDE